MIDAEKIRAQCFSSGFDLFGISNPYVEKSEFDFFRNWLAEGCGADMNGWLQRGFDKRANPNLILDGVKSVICLGVNYYPGDHEASAGLVARYAWGDDYHEIIGGMCKSVCDFLVKNYDDDPKWYTDTGAVFERYFAVKAGLGFVGKNTCLITREFGSWVLLTVIFSKIEFEPTSSRAAGSCGVCRRCIESCPTGALSEGCVDSRKCISYLTIEKRGDFSDAEKSMVAGQKFCFGCDKCQEVCPHNIRAKKTNRFNPKIESLSLEALPDAEFFKKSPIKRNLRGLSKLAKF
ncbi:MAG: tRNA epoxyqueuosine(34) reductase QueG [Candidatus Gracilibacteria bacterium]